MVFFFSKIQDALNVNGTIIPDTIPTIPTVSVLSTWFELSHCL